jgi:4-hydroxy 2-oxovalerate aldolase
MMDTAKIRVLDCTIRDGGLINDHYFSDNFVREVYKGLSGSGIDYIEVGYRSSKSLADPNKFGPWKFCEDEKINQVLGDLKTGLKIAIMVDAHRIKDQVFLPADKSPVDMIRTATYVRDIDAAIGMVNKAKDLGYEATANIMTISLESDESIISALKKLAASPVDVVYIVDSYGAMLSPRVREVMHLASDYLPDRALGIHCHNSLQMAFANTMAGLEEGASFADASLFGMGRGAGNCSLELLLGYLNNDRFILAPVLDLLQKQMLPLLEDNEWGYIIPFVITGLFNQHPRSALALRNSPDKDEYAKFFREILKSVAEKKS